jgi:chlorite dismutase
MDNRLAFGLRDIERDGFLVAIDADEISAFLRIRHEGRREAARIITRFRAFNLDHFGAKIAQHLRAGGAGKNAG